MGLLAVNRIQGRKWARWVWWTWQEVNGFLKLVLLERDSKRAATSTSGLRFFMNISFGVEGIILMVNVAVLMCVRFQISHHIRLCDFCSGWSVGRKRKSQVCSLQRLSPHLATKGLTQIFYSPIFHWLLFTKSWFESCFSILFIKQHLWQWHLGFCTLLNFKPFT